MKTLAAAFLLALAGAAHGDPVVAFLDPGGEMGERSFEKFGRLFDERVRPRFPQAVVRRHVLSSEDLSVAARGVAGALKSKPDVAVTADAYLARAVSEGPSGVPLVFLTLAEPVTMGIVDDPIAPRRNVTGYTLHVPFELKHIELLKECLPAIRRVGVLADPAWAEEPVSRAILQDSPRLFGVAVRLFDATEPREMAAAIAGARDIDAWYVPDTAPNRIHARVIAEAMLAARKPSIGGYGGYVDVGGLFVYSIDRTDPWPRAVEMVGLVLSGIPARDIPIERPRRFQLRASASAIRTLGIAVPRSVLLKVDELAR